MTKTDEFWPSYERLVARIVDPLGPSDGYEKEEVASAEVRLGFRLPGLLREFYLRAGKRADINRAHDRLVPPADLVLDGDRMVFFEENQEAALWSVRLVPVSYDPAVDVAVTGDVLEWEEEYRHVSVFLFDMLIWQAVNGGMTFTGIGIAAPEAIKSRAPGWERIAMGGNTGGYALIRDSQLVFVNSLDPHDLTPEIYAGGKTETDIAAIETAFSVRWGYRSWDDGRCVQRP